VIERYEQPDIRDIFDQFGRFDWWRSVETVWLAQASTVAAEFAAKVPWLHPLVVEGREAHTRHEFTAFLEVWVEEGRRFADEHPDEAVGQAEFEQWLHFGLTSSDVIDTALAMQINHGTEVLDQLAHRLGQHLMVVVEDLGDEEQLGRTHGQAALPRPAAHPLLVFGGMLARQRDRLTAAVVPGKLQGPVGTHEGFTRAQELDALHQLGVEADTHCTQIVPRDHLVAWAHAVSGLVTLCEAIADHYWFLAQSGIGEVTVGEAAPSSSMPHKRNPAVAENVRGLGRLARALAGTIDEGMVQRGDRDLAHSSVERVAIPDLAHLAATALERTARIVALWKFNPLRMKGNLDRGVVAGANSALHVQAKVRAGSSREDAMRESA
jgi:adenylosuccinate lyase